MASVTSNVRDEGNNKEEEDLYGPPPPDTVPASVLVVRAVDAPDDEHIDNYDMLNDVDDDYTLSEKNGAEDELDARMSVTKVYAASQKRPSSLVEISETLLLKDGAIPLTTDGLLRGVVMCLKKLG